MATPEQFKQDYAPAVVLISRELNVAPHIIAGQLGLETGWGRSVIPGTNNLGNIKDFAGGGVAAVDNMNGSRDRYRAYDSAEAFAADYVDLIKRKYPQAVGTGEDATKFARALKFGGYAEDPAYVKKVVSSSSLASRVGDWLAEAVFPAAQAGTLPAGGDKFADIFADTSAPAAPAAAAMPAPEPAAPAQSPAVPPTAAPGGKDPFADIFADVPRPKAAPITTVPAGPAAAPPQAAAPARSLAQSVGEGLMEIPRQVGLTARYAGEGLAQAGQLVTEPLRQFVVNPIARAVGAPEPLPLAQSVSVGADAIGLPQPKGANERVVGDVARTMAGAAGMSGVANLAARGLSGTAQSVFQALGANPGQQLASAAGAGAAGGTVREAGGDASAQAIAALFGGIAAPVATQTAGNVASGVSARLAARNTQAVEQQITLTLRNSDVDWASVPDNVRNMVRREVAQAMRTGEDLNGDAVRRLVDFGRVQGSTPTRGMLTLDPVQITRERNLAKTGANASDQGLQGLARVENQNNRALIDALNDAGANRGQDAHTVGQRAIDALERNVDTSRAGINALYSEARDSAGRSFPLDGAAFTRQADTALQDALLGGALPEGVRSHLNLIAQGRVPFTVDYAEQLKTRIGQLQRASSDGQTRMALGVVRQALEDTPVLGLGEQTAAGGARAVNPGGMPAIPGAAGASLGEEAIAAFNRGRGAHREFMGRVESTPALQAVYDGTASPDQFMQQFILGNSKNATARGVTALRDAVAGDAQATDSIRGYMAAWLKEKALNGAADEVGNFSASNFNKALQAIGRQKLSVFFTPAEIDQLTAVGRVSSYMTHQPRGSAVNNSNSGALMLGRGLDFLDKVSSKLPLLGIGPTVQGVVRSVQQGSAQRVAPALVNQAPRLPMGSTLSPAAVYGSLFALPGIPQGQDDRRP
ncbi:glucosaminidase domain-containing protein [Alcaligenaceae bacterium C4P045]|nr:glucosaminidase domain-containing protein [Alcaligenaceae bacterium C4P045]